MKERPILFSAPMVRAILDGRKTQTRRIAKDPVIGEIVKAGGNPGYRLCQYGQPGDRLWVRETWARNNNQLSDTHSDTSIAYRADGETRAQDNGTDLPWRPSIHMPRRASRILLEVTGVRVERLQDISEEDAIKEGARFFADIPIGVPHRFQDAPRWSMDTSPPNTDHCLPTARVAFGNLWNRINGDGSWDANPWVWVVSFRLIEGAA